MNTPTKTINPSENNYQITVQCVHLYFQVSVMCLHL